MATGQLIVYVFTMSAILYLHLAVLITMKNNNLKKNIPLFFLRLPKSLEFFKKLYHSSQVQVIFAHTASDRDLRHQMCPIVSSCTQVCIKAVVGTSTFFFYLYI